MGRQRRGRVGRAAKWAGAGACALLAGLWVLSVGWTVVHLRARAGTLYSLQLRSGCFVAIVCSSTDPIFALDWPPWDWERRDEALRWLPRYETEPRQSWTLIAIPLWAPLLLAGVPTGLMCLRGRNRRAAQQCAACGYDLAGLAPGAVCPECGAR